MEAPGETSLNIYGDIPAFDLGEEVEKLKSENKELGEQIQVLEETIETLQAVILKLRESQVTLKTNISALYLTAKSEIERKDRMINDLRTKIEDMCFRRGVYTGYKRKYTENVRMEHSAAKKFKYEDGKDNQGTYEGIYDRNSKGMYDRNRSGSFNDGCNRNRSNDGDERYKDDRGRRDNNREHWNDNHDNRFKYSRPDRNFEGRNEQRQHLERLKYGRQDTPTADKYSNQTATSKNPAEVIDVEEEINLERQLTKQVPSLPRTLSEVSSMENEENVKYKPTKKRLKLLTDIEKRMKKTKAGTSVTKTKQMLIKEAKKVPWNLIELEKDVKITGMSHLKSQNLRGIKPSKIKNNKVECMIDLTETDNLTQDEETSSFMDIFIVKDEDESEIMTMTEIQPKEDLKKCNQSEDSTKIINVEGENTKIEATSRTSEDLGTLTIKSTAQDNYEKDSNGSKEDINSSNVDGKCNQSVECSTKDHTVANIEGADKMVQRSSQIDTSDARNEDGKQGELFAEKGVKPLPLTKSVDVEKKDEEGKLSSNIKSTTKEIEEATVDRNTASINMPDLAMTEEETDLKESKRKSTLKDESAKQIEELSSKKKTVVFAEDASNINLKQNTTTAFFVKNKTEEIDSDTKKQHEVNSIKEEIKNKNRRCSQESEKNHEPEKVAPKNKRGSSIEDMATLLERKLHSLFNSESSFEEGEEEHETFSRERDDADLKEEQEGRELRLKQSRSNDAPMEPKRKINYSQEEVKNFARKGGDKESLYKRKSLKEALKEHKPKAEEKIKNEKPTNIPDALKTASKQENSKKNAAATESNHPKTADFKKWRIPKLKQSTAEMKEKESRGDCLKIEAAEERSNKKQLVIQCSKIVVTKETNKQKYSVLEHVAAVESKVCKESSRPVEKSKAIPTCSKIHNKGDVKENVQTREQIAVFSLLAMGSTNHSTVEDKLEPLKTPRERDCTSDGSVISRSELKKNMSRTSIRRVSASKEDSPKQVGKSREQYQKSDEKKQRLNCDKSNILEDEIESTGNAQRKCDVAKDGAAKQSEALKKVSSRASSRRRSALREDSPKVVEKSTEERQSKTVAEYFDAKKDDQENIATEQNTQLARNILKDKIDSSMIPQSTSDVAKDTTVTKVASRVNNKPSTLKEDSSKSVQKSNEERQSKTITEYSGAKKQDCEEAIRTKEKTQLATDILEEKIGSTRILQRKNDTPKKTTAKPKQESKKVASRASSRRGSTLKENSPKAVEKVREESQTNTVCSESDAKNEDNQEVMGTKEINTDTIVDKMESFKNLQRNSDTAKDDTATQKDEPKKVASRASSRRGSTLKEDSPNTAKNAREENQSKPVGENSKFADYSNPDQRQEPKKVYASVQRRSSGRRECTLKEDSPQTEKAKKVSQPNTKPDYPETDVKNDDRKEGIEAQLPIEAGSSVAAQEEIKLVKNSSCDLETDLEQKLKKNTEADTLVKTTVTHNTKKEGSQNDMGNSLQVSLEQFPAVSNLKTVKEIRKRVKITSLSVSRNTRSKLMPKKHVEEDDSDSESSASTNTSQILEEEKTKVVHNKLDNLIENYLEESGVENINDARNNQIGKIPEAPDANTRTRRRLRYNKSDQIKSQISASRSTPTTNSLNAIIARKRITPTPVKDDKPICSFENILEKTPSFPKIISPLHLTHEGEIPVLHLEENHISNLPTESNVNDKNIMNLLDTMNISNLECDGTKFKNITGERAAHSEPNSRGSNLSISPIKRNDNLTFENIIKKVTSTPIVNSSKPDECVAKDTVSSERALNPPAAPQSVRRRRRCRLIIAD